MERDKLIHLLNRDLDATHLPYKVGEKDAGAYPKGGLTHAATRVINKAQSVRSTLPIASAPVHDDCTD